MEIKEIFGTVLFLIWRRLASRDIRKSIYHNESKIEYGSKFINSSIGCYSYCGFNCMILNTVIGKFTSIADQVSIGDYYHDYSFPSVSSAFYSGRDSIKKMKFTYSADHLQKETYIGNDVWIGKRALIKQGVIIGDGAVVGMGSVVTHNVPAYAIVAGNPAKLIKYRFGIELIARFNAIKWWDYDIKLINEASARFSNPDSFISFFEERK